MDLSHVPVPSVFPGIVVDPPSLQVIIANQILWFLLIILVFIFFLSQVSTSQVSTSARPRLMPPPSTRPRIPSFPGVVVNPPGHEINIPGIVVDPPFLQVI